MTNPDNVGGLPELPEPVGAIRDGANIVGMTGKYVRLNVSGTRLPRGEFPIYTADQMRAYAELCRAAPAGGDVVAWMVTENGAPHYSFLTREQAESEASVYGSGVDVRVRPLVYGDSAPAGSGEVEEVARQIEAMAEHIHACSPEQKAERLRGLAALLRKLQQGAE